MIREFTIPDTLTLLSETWTQRDPNELKLDDFCLTCCDEAIWLDGFAFRQANVMC